MRLSSLQLKGIGPFENTIIEFPEGSNPDLADVYLLVGQNGCGKTTALHAIATMLSPLQTSRTEVQLSNRTWSPQAEVWLRAVSGESWAAFAETTLTGARPEGAGDVPPIQHGIHAGMTHFGPTLNNTWGTWILRANDNKTVLAPRWAAFSYSGARTFGQVKIGSIVEITEDPLKNALGFQNTADMQRLAQWVANQNLRRLQAKELGAGEEAAGFAESLNRIETAISGILGVAFRFEFSVKDINVRARLGTVVVDFGALPEGVKSVLSWIADLLMRLDRMEWHDNCPVLSRSFLLLLDEIDVHLHPAWQRKVLPVIQRLFPNAQIIASTHSPFVVASLKDGAVIELKLDDRGKAVAQKPVRAPLDMSYSTTLRSLFGIESDFDLETEADFKRFQAARSRAIRDEEGAREEFERLGTKLMERGEEIAQMVQFEFNQFKRARGPTGT